MSKKNILLITGASGLIGNALARLLGDTFIVLAPPREVLDICSPESVNAYFSVHKPSVVLHAGAYTDMTTAEAERGDTSGICWQTNVEGTKNITEASVNVFAQLLFLSTGSVFSGDSTRRSFVETDIPSNETSLSWYGVTKAQGEKIVLQHGGSIIRISHPLIPNAVESQLGNTHRLDYLKTALALQEKGKLYPLFTDQYFPLTDVSLLALAITTLIEKHMSGIYHVVSDDVVSPFELLSYALSILHKTPDIKRITFADFMLSAQQPLRYTQSSALVGNETSSVLGLPMYSWKQVVNKCVQ